MGRETPGGSGGFRGHRRKEGRKEDSMTSIGSLIGFTV